MILNKDDASLLVQYQPKAIATQEENDAAIALAEELEHRDHKRLLMQFFSHGQRFYESYSAHRWWRCVSLICTSALINTV